MIVGNRLVVAFFLVELLTELELEPPVARRLRDQLAPPLRRRARDQQLPELLLQACAHRNQLLRPGQMLGGGRAMRVERQLRVREVEVGIGRYRLRQERGRFFVAAIVEQRHRPLVQRSRFVGSGGDRGRRLRGRRERGGGCLRCSRARRCLAA